jgi:hypothetical protein
LNLIDAEWRSHNWRSPEAGQLPMFRDYGSALPVNVSVFQLWACFHGNIIGPSWRNRKVPRCISRSRKWCMSIVPPYRIGATACQIGQGSLRFTHSPRTRICWQTTSFI